MAALSDIFAAVRLQLDGTGFEAQATALANEQGQNVGDVMSKQLNSKLKSAVSGAIGAGVGLAFGAMVSGANDLDAATRQLQADTGMTADEAKAAEHALAGMYRNNLQGFDEIGATMAVVHNELGLVGDAADGVTERFLKYATATGQTAAPAASDFAKILKAFNIDASQTPAIMDKLIASHQVYGTVVTEDQAALLAMAPALDAMNMGVDDGIALLNLFQEAGISAAKAPMALAKAMKLLKPGEDINTLIAQISAIVDPTLRAQKAIEIFGVKGGVQLAQAFKPGITSLDQFTTSAEQNANATDDAAKRIEEGFGNKFKMIMKDAEGQLAEFGTSFNDLIGIASIFGPKMYAVLGSLGGVLSQRIVASIVATGAPAAIAGSAVGQMVGKAISMGAAAALAVAPVLILAATVKITYDYVNDQANNVNLLNQTSAGAAQAGIDELMKRRDAIKAALDAEKARFDPLEDIFGLSQQNNLQRQLDALDSMITAGFDKAAANAAAAGGNIVGDLAGHAAEMPGIFLANAGKMGRAAGAAGQDLAYAYWHPINAAAVSAKEGVFNALQAILGDFHTTWGELTTIGNEIADAIYGPTERASKLAANARDLAAQQEIASHKNLTKAQKHELDVQILDEQAHIAHLKKDHASADTIAAAQEKLAALKRKATSKDVTAAEKKDAQDRTLALQKEGLALRIEMAGRGELTGKAYAALIADLTKQSTSGSLEVRTAANLALAELAKLKAGLGALGNTNVAITFGKFKPGGVYGQAGGGPYAADQPFWVGEKGPELRVESQPGYTLTHQEAVAAVQGKGGGGNTYQVTVNNPEPRPAPEDIGRVLRRVAAMGMA